MTRAQAMKWVNALREKDFYKCNWFATNLRTAKILVEIWNFRPDLNHDEIADVIQLIYVEGALK